MEITAAETGMMTLHRESLNVRLIIREIIDLYQYAAEEKTHMILTKLAVRRPDRS